MSYLPRFAKPSAEALPPIKQIAASDVLALAKSILSEEEGDLPRPPQALSGLSKSSLPLATGRNSTRVHAIAAEGNCARPGTSADFHFTLVNEEAYAASCKLTVSDFLSDSGACLPASVAEGVPWAVTLMPNGRHDLTFSVRIPEGSEAGTYHALMVASPAISEPVVLMLFVGEICG
jgi:hypothetical protein